MTREKEDPEKRNLLNEPREEKKRRQYSGSRNKADRKSCESSSSEHRKRSSSYKISSTEQRAEFQNKATNQSIPFNSEKKDSWWFWQNDPPKQTEDTCSCVSCALKKIVSSEYACIGCLLLVFTISIVVAFLVVFKNVPNIGGDCKTLDCKDCQESTTAAGSTTPKCKQCNGVADSERLKRKIDMLSNKRLKKGFIGVTEFQKNDNRLKASGLHQVQRATDRNPTTDETRSLPRDIVILKGFDDVLSGHIGIPGGAGIDFGTRFRELNSVEDSDHRESKDIDLSNILDPDNIDIQNNEKLRDFYKKLIETDAKIKALKKINQDDAPHVEDDVLKSPERTRRSLKLYHYPKRYRILRQRRSVYGKQQKVNENSGIKTKLDNNTRLKRYNIEGDEPSGFIIEKKKLLVQYKPAGKRRIPVKKCQHAPAGTHTHEKQMMHPFYKNTQKLDLLLDKFLNKNLPEIISDPFGIDELFKHDKLYKPCKHPKPHKNVNIINDDKLTDQIPKPKFKFKKVKSDMMGITTSPDLVKIFRPESTTQYERNFFNHELNMIDKQKKKIVTASTSDFDVLLSIATVMSPETQQVTKRPAFEYEKTKLPIIDRVPNLRRLMQVEAGEDEENLGYEDFKEVLSDDMENHDEIEKSADRKRRDNDQPEPPLKYPKFNRPQSVLNPNWKGAMPLYPDEINSMITNKVSDPKPTDEIQQLLDAQRKGRDLSDIEYVEDYISNKFSRLVQQAQAYSDYGVLDGKKESRNDKDAPTADTANNRKIKLLGDENNKAGMIGRHKRGRMSRVVTHKANDFKRHRHAYISEVEVTAPAQTGVESHYIKVPSPKTHEISSEGIRIEMMPTTKGREDEIFNNLDSIMKIVSKHVKLKPKMVHTGKITTVYPNYIQSALISTNPPVGLIYNTKSEELLTEATTDVKSLEDLQRERELLFSITRGSRRLLSTSFENSSDFRDFEDSFGNRRGNKERDRNNIDQFVQRLHMNKNLESAEEQALKNYIEQVKQMNIKIFSTPGPSYDSNRFITESRNTVREEGIPMANSEVPDSEVTINKSLVKTDTGDSYFGKILLTVKDPEFGVQNFNLIFDVPLVTNFKEELMMMSDNINYPNVNNQFEKLNSSTIDPQVSYEDSYPVHGSEQDVQNKNIAKRLKRETNVTATWYDSTESKEFPKKDCNVTEHSSEHTTEANVLKIIVPADTRTGTNSSVSAAPAITLKVVHNNRSNSPNSTLKTNRCANCSVSIGDNMTLSEFFSVVSNWFRTLEYGKEQKPRNIPSSGLTDMLLTINNNITNESDISTTDSVYPLYDSDMIENIGHRSRVLLSVEDTVTNVTEENKVVNSTNATKITAASTADVGDVFNRTTSTTPVDGSRINVTVTKMILTKKAFPTPKKDNKTKIKAIIKRNADDSNLIFWNDIYDDEYGIQTDKIDNCVKEKLDDAVRDKHSVKEKDFIKKSGRWVQNKIRKFAKNLMINPHSNDVSSVRSDSMETKERVPRSIGHKNHGLVANPEIYDGNDYRVSRKEKDERDEIEEDYPDINQKSLFAALSVNMKEVCKKAAKAVQQTRNVDFLPENLKKSGTGLESKQGSIANALMQQLVCLLTDLVDYQVKQKTCTKLPSELQTFLEWLTYCKEETEDNQSDNQPDLLLKGANQDDEEVNDELRDGQEDKLEFPDEVKLTDKQYPADDISLYQDNRYSVQQLLEQYDDMTDAEKSKLFGVRDYLEKQMQYLNKQLSAYDLHKLLNREINRKKRNVFIMKQHSTKHRPRSKPHKFMRIFGKKHTRTTAGYNDEVQVTDISMNRKPMENGHTMQSASNKDVQQKLTKRNLKDVYYKAVEEAKKMSSVNIIHKKDDSSRFESSTAKGHK